VPSPAAEILDPERLRAVAEIWRRQKQVIETSFRGTSMLPAIAPGELVRVECGASFEVGDVVLYASGPEVVLHRLTAMESGRVWTRGDANRIPDPPISALSLIGRAVSVSRRDRWDSIARTVPETTAADVVARTASRLAGEAGARAVISLLWTLRWVFVVAPAAARRRVFRQ
jgi:hypothetical protein